MSKATKQSITMLSLIASVFYFVKYRSDNETIIQTCELGEKTVIDISKKWEGINNHKWGESQKVIGLWQESTENFGQGLLNETYVYIASRLLVDLQSRINNPFKLKLLSKLEGFVYTLEQYFDPDTTNYEAYEKGDELLDILYDLIEWRWE